MLGLLCVGGIGGNMMSAILDSKSIGVGASGAVFSVMGCIFVWVWLNYHKMDANRGRFLIFILFINFATLIIGFFEAHTDAWAHVGGLVVGVAYGVLNL
jgi:membrane associated rhomboid family serine protease